MSAPTLELVGVVKDYRGLRPLRIERLVIGAGEHVALMGLDQVAAEVLVNLITGATLPDQGDVRAFGRSTADISDSDAWLATADRFGIVSERAVLLDALTALQNLSMPFSLEIDPPAAEVAFQARALAGETGLSDDDLHKPVGELEPPARAKVRLARALAFRPDMLLTEHPTAGLPRGDVPDLARRLRTVATQRTIAALTITADSEFAKLVAARVITLEPASGKLKEARKHWLKW